MCGRSLILPTLPTTHGILAELPERARRLLELGRLLAAAEVRRAAAVQRIDRWDALSELDPDAVLPDDEYHECLSNASKAAARK